MSTGLPSSPICIAPSSTQVQWSQPEEKLQRPLSWKPPSTLVSLPVGA